MRSDSLKHKLLLSNPDFTTELCDKWASRSMLQGRLGVIEGLLFVNPHLGNQGEGNHANCLKLSASRSNLPESIQISSAVIDVTENDYFYRTTIIWGEEFCWEMHYFLGSLGGRFDSYNDVLIGELCLLIMK